MQISLKQQHLPKDARTQREKLGHSPQTLSFDPLIPNEVTLAEVLGFVEVLGEKGFDIPISVGGRSRFFHGSSGFLSLLGTARMLGLVSKTENRLYLTDIGLGFLMAGFPEQMGVLRASLSRIEPLKSTLALLSERKSVNALTVARRLSEKYAMGEFDLSRIHLVLIEWGLPTGLLEYTSDGHFRIR